MSRMTSRVRLAVWLAGAALAAPVGGVQPAEAPARAGSAPFDPPATRLLLTRVLHSPLADGNKIVSRRTFEIEIRRVGEGFRVEGRQVDCAVEAPAVLEPLAAIERQRVETGLFPMLLDASGRILPRPAPAGADGMDAAVPVALDMVRNSGLAPADAERATAFVRRLQAQPASSNWPADLFRPLTGTRQDDRPIVTPDGLTGHVRVEIEASARDGTGLLDELARTVTTDLGGRRRVTREEWFLVPAP